MQTPRIYSLLIALGIIAQGLQSGFAKESTPGNQPVAFDQTPRLAIISAFEPELDRLKKETRVESVQVINGRKYYLGHLAGHEVVLLLSGVSIVNATMTTQNLLDHFAIREIVFSGIAGGVNPKLRVGDVTVPSAWAQYQEHVFARETSGGWDAGPFGGEFPNYGMMFPHSVQVTRNGSDPEKTEKRFWFQVDPASLEIARGVAETVRLNRSTAQGESLKDQPKVIVGGKGVSGPTFVNNAAYREWVWRTFKADALDMETAAVGTVAYVNRVPFIAFRSLSDLAGGGGGKNEAHVFFKLAADNSSAVVLAYLQALDEKRIGTELETTPSVSKPAN